MLLLSGPPGSDATSLVLAEFRQALSRNAPNVRLLTPTATMVEHLRHKLAREGFVFRPGLIQTLSKFVAPWAEDLPEVSSAELYLIVEAIARRLAPPEFSRVLAAPGFSASLAQTIEEFSSAGCDSAQLRRSLPPTAFGAPFTAIYREVERELARRGLGLHSARLERAAQRIASRGLPGIDTVWIDGFFALTDPELEVVRAIASHADLTITLPNLDGPNPARDALLAMGFEERRVESRRAGPAVAAFSAATVDREAEEIARRIHEQIDADASFRDIGIIVRNPETYLAPIRAALERFGIPARFYFSDPLAENGTVRYLSAIVDALLSDWDYAKTLAALRLSGDTPALDAFDFAVREKLPGRGLDGLAALTRDPHLLRTISDLLRTTSDLLRTTSSFGALDGGPPGPRLAPRPASMTAAHWATRLSALRTLIPPPTVTDHIPHETAMMHRAQSAALTAFEAALQETTHFLEADRRIPLADFWIAAQAVLRLSTLRIPDHRRNVVHVLSVFEARQWELASVFICGLAEQQFPKRHTQNPLFPDSTWRAVSSRRRLRTTTELESEERFLFELAATRAAASLTFSYPEADARGVRNLPSQFLTCPVQRSTRLARPQPPAQPADTAPLTRVTHARFSPSGLECFLDCPFQFFARHTLKLKTRPPAPQDRLDFLLQGTIIHQALAEWHKTPQPIEPLFDRIFAAACAERAVFRGYRTEYLRRQMLDDLRQFCESGKLPPAGEVLTELPFDFQLDDSMRLRGRIDRVDKLPGGRALIVDYKYSAAQRVAARMTKESLLQGGLYALAVERELGLEPAAVFYFGLKKDLKVVGWSDPPDAFGVNTEPLTREWIDSAAVRARQAADEIRAGRITPDPADSDLCRICDYRDVCRFVAQADSLRAPSTT